MQGKTISFGAIHLYFQQLCYDGPIYADGGDLPPDQIVTNLQSTLRPQGYCDAEAEWKALFTSLAGQLANDVNELVTALC